MEQQLRDFQDQVTAAEHTATTAATRRDQAARAHAVALATLHRLEQAE
jgi:hypothetical protein